MNKTLKKTLTMLLSASMIAASVVLPTAASADAATWSKDATSWKFDFGSTENVADGYIGVAADTKYSAQQGYGFVGLENGYAVDTREDGWTMTQGFDLALKDGANDTVTTADDDWVATTKRDANGQDYISPIRFSMKVYKNTYYTVKVKICRDDAAKDAYVSLFTEKRHQHLLNEAVPAGGIEYTTNVYVHDNWSKNTQNYEDTQLSIAALGENVAISSIEIEKKEQGKTFWILGDSTVCQQSAPIPYFPLDHCQGVGSAMTKYISNEWAIVNEAESGLDAKSASSHFNNMKNDIKEGDVVWFEFGHNDDKVSNDPSTNGYLTSLASYYGDITTKKANLIIASPVERDQQSQFSSGTWHYTLSHYTTAASNYVNEQIAAGKTNIAFINLNTRSLEFLNKVQTDTDKIRTDAGLKSLGFATTRFYYYVSKYAGYKQDYTHPNDYGADNFAYLAIDEAKKTIAAAGEADATDNTKKQAAVLSLIFGDDTRNYTPQTVADEIVLAGAPTNSFYPAQLAQVVLYENPIIVNKVEFDGTENTPSTMTVTLVPSEKEYSYGRGVIDIYDKDGTKKGTVKTTDVVDAVSSDTQVLTFAESEVAFDSDAGDTFNAYVIKIERDEVNGGYIDTSDVISTTYTQDDMIDVKEYLIQGNLGTENKEDFSTYDLAEGDSIIGKNGWTNPGGETFAFGQDSDGTTFAHCLTTGSATYYPEKKFAAVNSGQLLVRFDVRYTDGTVNLNLTDGTAGNNFVDSTARIVPLQIKKDNAEVKVSLAGQETGKINVGSWVTLALTIDFDHGTYTLKLDGKTYTQPFSGYDTTSLTPKPNNISLICFQNGKDSNEYDITNLVIATLNTPELEKYTATVDSNDNTKGTVSVSGANTTGVALGYNDGTASIKADKAMKVQFIEAKYNADKTLNQVIPTELNFTGAGTKTVDVTAGSKLMVWDSLSGMKPVVDAIEATGTIALPADNEVTDTINTVTTVTANAAAGNVFMGWYDNSELTGEPVSMDNPYTFRLREDTTLTAKFVKEPSVSDITDYSLVSDKSNIKAVSGATFNVSIADAVDNANTPISVATNADATWESQTAGVTVADGVVTIGSDFAISAGETKPITIKATLNNIEKTCTVTAHLYDYLENFDSGDLTKMNWFTNVGAGSTTIVDNALQLKGNGSSNNTYSGMHFAAPADVTDKLITIKFDYKTSSVGSGNGTSHIFLTDTTSNTPTWNVSGVSFHTDSTGIGLTANTEYAFTITINNKTKTATVSAQPAEGAALTYDIADTKVAVSTLFFRPGKGITDTVDNVSVVISDAPTA